MAITDGNSCGARRFFGGATIRSGDAGCTDSYIGTHAVQYNAEPLQYHGTTGRSLIPTAENIAVVIYNRLRARLDTRYDLHIRLYETARNMVEYPG